MKSFRLPRINVADKTGSIHSKMITVSIIESDSAEALAAASLEMTLAGAIVNRIPVMEIPTGDAEGTVEKLKT